MAYLETDDKQKKDGEDAAGGAMGGGASLGSSGEAATSAGTGSSASPAGAGGQSLGGFTNIQSYLNANSGNSGSSDRLAKQVGSAFDYDKQAVQEGAGQVKQQAQDAASKSVLGQDAASKLISEAGKAAGTGKAADDAYGSAVSQLKSGVNAQYTGPTSYNYGVSADTQKYGNNLGNDQGFKSMVNDMYQKSAQGPDGTGRSLGSGGLALQDQIDTTDGRLANTRQQLLSNYAGLNPFVDDVVGGANSEIEKARGQVATNAGDLKSYLQAQSSQKQKDLASAAVDELNKRNAIGTKAASQFTPNVKSYFSGYNPGDVNADNVYNPTLRTEFNAIADALGSTNKYDVNAKAPEGLFHFDQHNDSRPWDWTYDELLKANKNGHFMPENAGKDTDGKVGTVRPGIESSSTGYIR